MKYPEHVVELVEANGEAVVDGRLVTVDDLENTKPKKEGDENG